MAKRKKSTFERLSRGGLNRKQRRDLGRRLAGNDPGLTIIHSGNPFDPSAPARRPTPV